MKIKLKRFFTDLHYSGREKRKDVWGYLIFILIALLVLGVFAAYIIIGYAIASLRPSQITTVDEFKYAIDFYQAVLPIFFWFALGFSLISFLQFAIYGQKTKIFVSALLTALNSFLAWGMWLQPKALDRISKQLKLTDNSILEKVAGLNFTSESYHFWLTLVLVALSVNLLANAINDKS